jgi:hypothetical protein
MRYFLTLLSILFLGSTLIHSHALAQDQRDPSPKKPPFFNKEFFKKKLRKKRKKSNTIRGLTFSEYGLGKPNYKNLKSKVNSIKEREIISLDLIVKNIPQHFPEGSPCKGTEWGSLSTNSETTIHVLPIIGNLNMIFEILPGSREKFPFTSVSCVYNPTTPQQPYVRFTGFFVVHHHVVPSAVLHEFRAIARPSFLR